MMDSVESNFHQLQEFYSHDQFRREIDEKDEIMGQRTMESVQSTERKEFITMKDEAKLRNVQSHV